MKNDPPRLKRVTDAMLMTLPPPDDWDDPQSSNAPGAWPVMSLVKPEHMVGSDSQPTVGSVPEPTVGLESEPTVLAGVFYLAEDLGALFPVTRVKRIDRAQDALTAKEEAVYDAIWKSGDAQQGLSTWSYTDLASHKDVRSDKRNVAKLVRRLVQKGFIEIVRQGGGARTQKTVYRAFGYGPVLQAQRRRGICGVVKTGNGVFYAIKVVLPGPLTVGSGSGPTVVPGLEPTVDRRSEPTVDRRPPHTFFSTEHSSTGAASVVVTGRSHAGIRRRRSPATGRGLPQGGARYHRRRDCRIHHPEAGAVSRRAEAN